MLRTARDQVASCPSDALPIDVVVIYSTGDLPSTRARNSAGSSRAARASSAPRGSQPHAGEIGGRQRVEAGEEASRAAGVPERT